MVAERTKHVGRQQLGRESYAEERHCEISISVVNPTNLEIEKFWTSRFASIRQESQHFRLALLLGRALFFV